MIGELCLLCCESKIFKFGIVFYIREKKSRCVRQLGSRLIITEEESLKDLREKASREGALLSCAYLGFGSSAADFVKDASNYANYYMDIFNAGLMERYSFNYCNNNRSALNKMEDYKQFLRMAPSDEVLIKDFVDYAAANGVAPRWYYINLSRDLIVTRLKALIARDAFGNQAFYPIVNRIDKTLQEALKALNKHKAAFPITD